ncbi:hypothetical protein N7G274_002834 [Stereocaulon virgatum]|uniref:Transmembrane protein n=1 Tax=Stereocaulon virgatum TaxID=373712 RepID=A0ABR4AGZ8_9LECA
MESINVTGFFKDAYTVISDRIQDMQLPQLPPIDHWSIYPSDIPIFDLGMVIFISVISIASLYKLATINKKVHETASAIEAEDETYHEIRHSTFEVDRAMYDCCPSDDFSFPSSIEEKRIVFSDPFAPKPLSRTSYRGRSGYDLRTRPTPRTEKGWYALVQQSTRGPKSGDKRKATKECEELTRKRSRGSLFA